jgi:hypothetical protein
MGLEPLWSVRNTPPGALNLTFALSNPRVGLVCTGYVPSSTDQPRLYKTTDGGQSWQEVTGLPPIQIPSGSPCARAFLRHVH